MPLATPSEARAEFARNAGSEFPDRAWVLTDWDTWEPNPHYRGPAQRHPEDDSDHYVQTNRDRLLIAAGRVILDSAMRAQERAEHAANVAAWEAKMDAWNEATKVHRSPGCRCSDEQLVQVGCGCMPW